MSIGAPISLYASVRALECLCAISLLIQTLEFLRLRTATSSEGVWSWQVQRADVAHAPDWLRKVFDLLYRDRLYHLHLLLRAGAVEAFGRRDEILPRLTRPAQPPRPVSVIANN